MPRCTDGLVLMGQERFGTETSKRMEVAALGGGCFWRIEAVFSQLKGVEKVESGYAEGKLENPTYEQVSAGKTGHAEVAQITLIPL